jgi:DnaK suppressor protein
MSTLEKQKASQTLYGVEPYRKPRVKSTWVSPCAHFTKLLNGWKQELMASVDKTVDHMKDEAANFPDPADRASQEEEFALELRNRDRERKLIKKIDKTLQLIEDEEYGWCESCGIGLPPGSPSDRGPVLRLQGNCREKGKDGRQRLIRFERGAAPRFIYMPSLPMTPPSYIGRFAPTPAVTCTSARWSPPSPPGSTPAPSTAAGCCAWKTPTRHGKCPAPAMPSCRPWNVTA